MNGDVIARKKRSFLPMTLEGSTTYAHRYGAHADANAGSLAAISIGISRECQRTDSLKNPPAKFAFRLQLHGSVTNFTFRRTVRS